MKNILLTWTIASILIISPTTKAASLICYKGSITDFKELSLKESPQFVNTTYMPENCDLKVVAHGYSANVSDLILNVIANLIQKYGDTGCYCALNWAKEAAAYLGFITKPIEQSLGLEVLVIDYLAVSAIATVVVEDMTNALKKMGFLGLILSNVDLIGHSEGAHLVGNVGKNLNESGTPIRQITGLDPAKPSIQKHLKKGDAKLVVCIHTNPTGLGTNEAVCDIDFWVNCGCNIQPGCEKNAVPLTPEGLCSHKRALVYEAEAILNPKSFQGRKAASCEEFLKSSGTPDPDNVNFMGCDIKPNITGSFYLGTNAEPEFGKGPAGMDPSTSTC